MQFVKFGSLQSFSPHSRIPCSKHSTVDAKINFTKEPSNPELSKIPSHSWSLIGPEDRSERGSPSCQQFDLVSFCLYLPGYFIFPVPSSPLQVLSDECYEQCIWLLLAICSRPGTTADRLRHYFVFGWAGGLSCGLLLWVLSDRVIWLAVIVDESGGWTDCWTRICWM